MYSWTYKRPTTQVLTGVLALGIGGCYERTTPPIEARLCAEPAGRIELELRYHVEGRGNVHTLSLSKYQHENSDWLYTGNAPGVIDATGVVLTNRRKKTEFPWSISPLQGRLLLDGRLLVVDLRVPVYAGGNEVVGYRSYEFNGKYPVVEGDCAMRRDNASSPQFLEE
jgi:hypothetical protein